MYKLLVFLCFSLLFSSCEKKENTLDNNTNNNSGNQMLNLPSGVSWDDITSTILLQRNNYYRNGNFYRSNGIDCSFFNGSGSAVDAGEVIFNNDTITKNQTSGVYGYTSFDTMKLNHTYNVNVTGSSNYPAFTSSITTPQTDLAITSHSPNSNISKGSNLTLTWSGTYESNANVRIVLLSPNGSYNSFVADNGSITIPSSQLSNLSNGNGSLSMTRTKYILKSLPNGKYSAIISLVNHKFDVNIVN